MTVEWILGSTALILAVLLVRAALGRRTGARLRYGLWLLVLLRLLLPVSFGHSAASPANLASPGRHGGVRGRRLCHGTHGRRAIHIRYRPDGQARGRTVRLRGPGGF